MPFQILADYPQFPMSEHVCSSCRAGRRTGERIIDLNVAIDIRGDHGGPTGQTTGAYLCESCVIEIAGLIGLVTPEQADAATARADSAAAALAATRLELADVRAVLDPLLARLQSPEPIIDATEAPAAKKTKAKATASA